MEDTEELKVSEEPDEQMDNEYECEQNNQQSEQGQAKVSYKSDWALHSIIIFYYYYLLQLGFHPVAVVLTIVHTIQMDI
jgi:hypothetical protein